MVLSVLIGIVVALLLGIGILLALRLYGKHIIKRDKALRSKEKHMHNIEIAREKLGVVETKTKVNPNADHYKHLRSRFGAIGVFVTAAFSVLIAKLFSIQVVNGEKYSKEATANATSSVNTPAPRGYIYDSDGVALVKNKTVMTVLAEPDVAYDDSCLHALSSILGLPFNIVKNRVLDQSVGTTSRRVVASDVTKKQAAYIAEHVSALNGVTIESRTVRQYPYGALAAHILGYTGTASENDLTSTIDGQKIESGDTVGKSGIESKYDALLSGDHGQRVVVSDADGNIIQVKSEIQPTKGSDIRLTIKAPVQYATDKILAETIAPNGVIGTATGGAGSVVVMDVTDGSIIALSNYPTYKPSVFTNGVSQDA